MEPNLLTHRLISQVVQEDGSLLNEYEPREQPLDTGNHHQHHQRQWLEVRRERDQLLAESDWVVARAYERGEPVPADWVTYRQALRDITLHNNPFQITWPVRPAVNVPAPPTVTVAVPQEEI